MEVIRDTNRFVRYNKNKPGGIEIIESSIPSIYDIPENHVLVSVRACGVNPVDAKYCWGDKLPQWMSEQWKRILMDGEGVGFDFAGEIVDTHVFYNDTYESSDSDTYESSDSDTEQEKEVETEEETETEKEEIEYLKAGDRVFGTMPPMQASFSEYIIVPKDQIAKIPDNITFTEAASYPLVGITAIDSLQNKFKLKEGQTILIIGASGGVGSVAVQIAKHIVGRNGKVVAVCSKKNHSFVKNLGAHVAFDYSEGLCQLMGQLQAYIGNGNKFDLVLDCVYSIDKNDQKYNYIDHIHFNNLLKSELNSPETSKSNYITIGGSFFDWIKANIFRKTNWNFFTSNHELYWINFSNTTNILNTIIDLASKKKLKSVIEEIPVNQFKSTKPIIEGFNKLIKRHVTGKLVLTV